MASIKYLLAITIVIIIAFNFVLSAPVSSEKAVAKENDSEESPENVDKPIPAKANAAALNEQDTDESSDSDDTVPQKPEHAHKHRDHSDHIDVIEGDDLKAKKVVSEDDDDHAVKPEKASDKASGKSSKKTDADKSAALEADKPAATSESEEEAAENDKKPLVDNTYPKAPAAIAAEDREQASRELADKAVKDNNAAKPANNDSDSDDDDDEDSNKKNEEVPAPMKGSGTMTQEAENEGVANLTEDKQMDERQDGITINASTTKSPNSGISASTSFSLIFLSIILYLLQ